MPLHSEVKEFINTVVKTGDTFNWNGLAKGLPLPDGAASLTTTIPVEGGDIPATVFDVAGEQLHEKSVLIYIPGGGFCPYLKDAHNHACATMAKTADCRVIMIEPHTVKAPGQVADACSAIKHIMENSKTFDIKPDCIALGGDSSGANLALSAALDLSNEGISLQHLVLISGTYDLTMNTTNEQEETYKSQYKDFESKDILSEEMFDAMFEAYLPEGWGKNDPRVSPYFRENDIRNLRDSETSVSLLVSEFDGVRHQTHQLADRLNACGVRYTLEVVPGQTHSGLLNRRMVPTAPNPAEYAGKAVEEVLSPIEYSRQWD